MYKKQQSCESDMHKNFGQTSFSQASTQSKKVAAAIEERKEEHVDNSIDFDFREVSEQHKNNCIAGYVTISVAFREKILKNLIGIRLRKKRNLDVRSFVPGVINCSPEPLFSCSRLLL